MKRRQLPIVVKSGTWHADYVAPETGERIRYSLALPATVPAREAFREFERRESLRSAPPSQTVSVVEAIARVIAFKLPAANPKTVAAYERVSKLFLSHCSVQRIAALCDVTPETVASFVAGEVRRGRKPRGIASDLVQIGAFFSILHSWGLLPGYSPRAWIAPHKSGLTRAAAPALREITPPELSALLSDPVMGDLFTWLYITGARIGVSLQLRAQDIDRKQGIVRYPPGKQGQRHEQPLTADMRSFLAARRPVSGRGFLLWRDRWGDPFDQRQLHRAESHVNARLKRVLAMTLYRAEYDRLRAEYAAAHDGRTIDGKRLWPLMNLPHVHDLRATCAMHLLTAMGDPLAVCKFVGWKSPSVLIRHYDQRRARDLSVPSLLTRTGSVQAIK